jgi:Fe-S cluster biogenesis protein NfuA
MTDTGITIQEMDGEVIAVVNKEIDRIRHILEAHKGGVEIVEASRQKLILKLKGHCAGCPLASITYGKVLDKYIKDSLPGLEISYLT